MRRSKINDLVLPLALFAIGYFSIDLFVQFERMSVHLTGRVPELDVFLFGMHRAVVMFSVGLVAAGRIFLYHPQFKAPYRKWLMITPWTAGHPLPLGSISANWTDAVVVFATIGVAWVQANVPPIEVAIVYLLSYVAVSGLALFVTVQNSAFPLAFGGAVVVFLIPNLIPTFIASAVLFVLANLLVQRSLLEFPWSDPPKVSSNKTAGPGNPFEQLSPKPPRHFLKPMEGLILSVLFGCWAAAIASHLPMQLKLHDFVSMTLWIGFTACFFRWVIFAVHGGAPISIAGRIFTGRIIIPGYDKIFVAPLCSLIALAIIPWPLHQLGLAWPVWFGITTTLFMASLLCIGPTLASWRLTGATKIRRIASSQLYIRE